MHRDPHQRCWQPQGAPPMDELSNETIATTPTRLHRKPYQLHQPVPLIYRDSCKP